MSNEYYLKDFIKRIFIKCLDLAFTSLFAPISLHYLERENLDSQTAFISCYLGQEKIQKEKQ